MTAVRQLANRLVPAGRRLFLCCLALLCACLLLRAPEASACKCAGIFERFLDDDDAHLPANAAGVAWWAGPALDPTPKFKVERIDGKKASPVRFKVRKLEDEVFLVQPACPTIAEQREALECGA